MCPALYSKAGRTMASFRCLRKAAPVGEESCGRRCSGGCVRCGEGVAGSSTLPQHLVVAVGRRPEVDVCEEEVRGLHARDRSVSQKVDGVAGRCLAMHLGDARACKGEAGRGIGRS